MLKLDKHKRRLLLIATVIASVMYFYLFTTLSQGEENLAQARYVVTTLYIFIFSLLFLRTTRIPFRILALLLFATYGAANLLIRLEWQQSLMWALWFVYVAFVFPALFSRNRKSVLLIEYVLWALIVVTTAIVVYAYNAGIELAWEGERYRFTGGTENPGVLGKTVATIFWLSLLAYACQDKTLYLLITFFALMLLFYIDMRTDLYGALLGLFAYALFTQKVRYKFAIAWLIATITVVAILSMKWSRYEFDELLSGRISFWVSVTEASDPFGSFTRLLFGTGSAVLFDHYDNQWIEIVLRYGVIGFVLFGYFFAKLFFSFQERRSLARTKSTRNLHAWAMSATMTLGLMGFTAYIMPSLGNVYNLILFPTLMAIYLGSFEQEGQHFSVDHRSTSRGGGKDGRTL